ncbi:MAG: M48 family metallopeptidase [Myxococcota bacterium]
MRSEPRQPDDAPNIGRQTPVRDVVWLLTGTVAFAACAAALLGWFAESIVVRISMDTEREIFAPLGSSMLEGLGGAGASAEADQALASLFEPIAAAAQPMPYEWKVHVLCDETPNAMALPGGIVVVTSGLLARLSDESQLAFILGHELGHFIHRDQLRGLGRSVAIGVILQGVLSMGGVDGASVVGAAINAAQTAHGRDQEIAADRVGLSLLHQTRGHASGAVSVMGILAEAGDESWVNRFDFTRTHPVGDVRIAALQAVIDARGWPTTAPATPLPPALRAPCPGPGASPE